MILVTLGTQDKEFTRLIEEIDNLIDKKVIKEEVIVQAGCTRYKSRNIKIFDLIPHDEFEKIVSECSLLITHGGVGSILTGLKKNKVVIAVPRLKRYNEHESDHQLQIIKEFDDLGYIIGLKSVSELEQGLEKAKSFKPNKFKSNNKEFVSIIDNYIEEEEKKNHSLNINKIITSVISILVFNLFIRIVLESFFLKGKGDELISLIISWIFISFISLIIKHNKEALNNICKNCLILLVEYFLVLLLVVLPGITSLWLKILIYILTLCISYIIGSVFSIVFLNKKNR